MAVGEYINGKKLKSTASKLYNYVFGKRKPASESNQRAAKRPRRDNQEESVSSAEEASRSSFLSRFWTPTGIASTSSSTSPDQGAALPFGSFPASDLIANRPHFPPPAVPYPTHDETAAELPQFVDLVSEGPIDVDRLPGTDTLPYQRPAAHPSEPRLSAFKAGKSPQDGAVFAPTLPGQVAQPTPKQIPVRRSVLQRHEDRRYQTVMQTVVLRAREAELRQQRKTKEADKTALCRHLLLERQRTADIFEEELIECQPSLAGAPAKRSLLGTETSPLADPLGLSLYFDELNVAEIASSLTAEEADSLFRDQLPEEASAFKPVVALQALTASRKIELLQLRWAGRLHASKKLAQTRDQEILYEKEQIMMKQIMKRAEDKLRKAQDVRTFAAEMVQTMLMSRIRSICQRVLPIEPLGDILRRYKTSRAPTMPIPNKEFLPLAEEDLQKCFNAWNPRLPEDEVQVSAAGMKILRKDLRTLAGSNWLNDEVINMYMELLKERSSLPGFPKCYFFNTFFYERLTGGGASFNYANVRRWTRKVDIFSFDKVIVPIHLSAHWASAVLNIRDRRLEFYDSLGSEGRHHLKLLEGYMKHEHEDKRKAPLDTSFWTFHMPGKTVPQQQNFSDCGVFSCKFMNLQAQDLPFDFSQAHIPYFRQRLVIELLSGKVI